MSDPNVVNSEMNPSNLSDAEIESILSGGPVAGAPDQLTEFVAVLKSEVGATPGLTPGLALADFMSAAPVSTAASSGSSTVTSIFRKTTAAAGAVSFKILLGAAAAAAGVGGAQAAGVIDLPGIGSEATEGDLPPDPEISPQGTPTGDLPSITVPTGGSSEVVSVPPLAELVDTGESSKPGDCVATPQGPTNASSTSNPSESNRQASGACNANPRGQGNGLPTGADDRGTGSNQSENNQSENDQSENDRSENDQSENDQSENDQSENDQSDDSQGDKGQADNDPKPAKPGKSEQPDSPPNSGPKKEK